MAKLKNNIGAKYEQHLFHLVDPSALPFSVSAILGVILYSLAFFHGVPGDTVLTLAQLSWAPLWVYLFSFHQRSVLLCVETKAPHSSHPVDTIYQCATAGSRLGATNSGSRPFKVAWKPNLHREDFDLGYDVIVWNRRIMANALTAFQFDKAISVFKFMCDELNNDLLLFPINTDNMNDVTPVELLTWLGFFVDDVPASTNSPTIDAVSAVIHALVDKKKSYKT